VNLAELIITTAGDNRVSLPAVFETTSPLNGAMDNFDCNKNPSRKRIHTGYNSRSLSKYSQ